MRIAGLVVGMLALGSLLAPALAQSVPMPTPRRELIPSQPRPGPTSFQSTRATGGPNWPEANHRSLVDRVSLYLSSIQTLVGEFVQVGPDGVRTEGQLYVQKPGKVRFEYNPPSVIDVIADGSSVVVRDRKLATQDLYPLSQTPLRYLLADRIDLLRDTNVVSIGADDVFVSIGIEEKHRLIGTQKLLMMFSAKDLQLRQWTVTDPQGYDTTVAVYNLDANKKPDPRMFVINYDNNSQRVQ